MPCEKLNYQPPNPGSLVSAGFKVSASGGGAGSSSSPVNNSNRINKTTSHQHLNELGGSKYYAIHKISTVSDQPIMTSARHEEKSQLNVVRKSYR